jgi:putative hydrolase of the HAD superfamily
MTAPAGLVIFDLDNTLVDRDRFFLEWLDEFVRRRSLDAGARAVILDEDMGGRAPRRAFFVRVAAGLGLPDPIDRLVDEYWQDQLGRYRCDDATRESLLRLRGLGYRLAIATNGGRRQLDKIRACGLTGVVDCTAVSSIVGAAKPDPRIFEFVARECGLPLATAWIVGDRAEDDIAGAVAARVRSAWISRGRPWPALPFEPTLIAAATPDAVARIIEVRPS